MYPEVRPVTRCLLAALVLASAIMFFWGAQPPRALPLDAAPDVFSGQRALEHSYKFAVESRPRGGYAAARGRDYILRALADIGVEAEVQRDPVNHGMFVSFVENVIARIPGTDSKQTIAMTAHYDSVAWGPGAADDGAGVVVMLEVARALKCGAPMKEDVVFIFTGDEEGGGNGSVVSLQHRWLEKLNIMIGLEGRGDWGTAYMFETSEGNLPLMLELQESGAPAVSNSIMYQVHKRTPNTTDFTHMTHHGVVGYNVAFVGGLGYYHTANDKPQHLSPQTLQHQGEYVMAILRHYDAGGPKIEKGGEAVFFNTVGNHLVVYPAEWSRYVTLGAILVFALCLGLSLYLKGAGFPGTLGALLMALVTVALTLGIGGGLTWVTYKIFYVYGMYNAWYYHVAFMLLGTSLLTGMLAWWRTRLSPGSLQAGVLLIWLAVLIYLEIKLPITSYSSAWPLAIGGLGLLLSTLLRHAGWPVGLSVLVQTLSALPALAFLVPGTHALYHMGGVISAAGTAVLVLLTLWSLAPALLLITGEGAKRLAQVSIVLAIATFLTGWAMQRYTAEAPKMNSVSYALNLDTNTAAWFTTDKVLDEWVRQFIPADKEVVGDLSDVLPGRKDPLPHAPAPVAPLAASELTVVEDTTEGAERKLVLQYTAHRSINSARFEVLSPAKVIAASIDGMGDVLGDMSGWSLSVGYLPHDGKMTLRLTLDAAASEQVSMLVKEETFALPELTQLGYRPRPEWMIPKPNTLDWWESNHIESNYSFVSKTYGF